MLAPFSFCPLMFATKYYKEGSFTSQLLALFIFLRPLTLGLCSVPVPF